MNFLSKNFLICPGVEKCGTTSLHSFLHDQKGLVLPRKKETFFFNGSYDKGPDHYLSMFDVIPQDVEDVWYTDITPSYFRRPKTLNRIKNDLTGNVVIVFLIRNPVKRAFSFYWHDLARHISKGEKTANNFKQFRNFSFEHMISQREVYFLTSYAQALETWMEAFPDNVIVHTIEDIIQNPDSLIEDINAKTGLSLATGKSYPKENTAQTATLSIYPDGIRRHDEKGTKKILLPRHHAINAMAMQGTFTHFLSKEECERIFDVFFKEDTEKCEKILGRNLPDFYQQTDLISPIVKSFIAKNKKIMGAQA